MSPYQGPEALLEVRKSSIKPSTIKGFNIESIQNHSFFPLIYSPCHSRKSINRAPFLLQKGTLEPELEEIKGEIEDCSCPLAPPRPPPDHRLKALQFAGPPPKGPT
ncbi:hypothetical protein M5K25_016516, partial [Dendrobium thyrsiflorum]